MPNLKLSHFIRLFQQEMALEEWPREYIDAVPEMVRRVTDGELSYTAARNPNSERVRSSPSEAEFEALKVGAHLTIPLWARRDTLAHAVSRFNNLYYPRRFALRATPKEYRIFRMPDRDAPQGPRL